MLSLLTLVLAAPFAQASSLSAPKFSDGDALIGPSAGQELAPALAHGSGVTLAVWSDQRSVLGGYAGGPLFSSFTAQSDADILAQRFDAQGVPLDAVPFVISAAHDRQIEPLAAFNGQDFLVAWLDAGTVRAARISTAGVVLDAASILVDSAADAFGLAANGSTWLIVTESYSAGSGGLVGYRVASNGALLDPSGVVLVPATYFLFFGAELASANGEWLLVYNGANGPVAQRVDAALSPLGSAFAVPSRSLTSNGARYLFAWQDAAHRLLVSRMKSDGVLLDPTGIEISNSWWWNDGATTLAWGNAQWWIAFGDFTTGLSLARVTDGGSVLDPGGFSFVPAALDPEQAVLTGLSSGVQAAWLEYQSTSIGATQSYSQTVLGPGNLGTKSTISTSAPAQVRPDFAEHDAGIAMAFWSLEGVTAHLKVALLDRFGNATQAEPIEVFAGPSGRVFSPAIAWNGSLFLVVWSDRSTGIAGRRLRADGTFVDPAPFPILVGEEADVAALGGNFLVVGAYAGLIYSNRSIYGTRVDGASGTVLDPGGIYVGGPFAANPVVDSVGNRWIVSWQNHWSSNSTIADLALCFVTAAGVSQGAVGVENLGYSPDIASNGSELLLTYRSGSIASPFADVKAQRIRADGAFLGSPVVIAGGGWKEFEPAVCWNGAEWLVAWEDLRNAVDFTDGRTQLYGARVNAAGVVLDPAGFALSPQPGMGAQVALAGGQGVAVAGYTWMRREAPWATWRVATRTIGPWTDLGFALAGGSGAPRLDAAGALSFGSTVEMALSHARPFANGMLFAGRVRVDQPFYGGTLVPRRDRALPFSADADGRALLQIPVTRALPPGLTMHVQAWIQDPSGPQGATASNALLSIAP